MILHDVWSLGLVFSSQKTIEIEPVAENISTDTGLLLFRQFDEQLGLTAGFAAQLSDSRLDPRRTSVGQSEPHVATLRSGRVVDPDGRPLAGVQVLDSPGQLPRFDLAIRDIGLPIFETVTDRELGQQGIDRSYLDPSTAAGVAQLGSLDVIFPIRNKKW